MKLHLSEQNLSLSLIIYSSGSCLALHRPDDGGSMQSETSVNFYETTPRNIPEGFHLHERFYFVLFS
jgi:hypothetical protein